MALYDAGECEHVLTIYGPPVTTTDSAGGEIITWPTVRTADVPCIINSTGAHEELRFDQMVRVQTFTISFLSEYASPERGDKGVDADGNYHHFTGIKSGLAMGGIPALTYIDTEVVS